MGFKVFARTVNVTYFGGLAFYSAIKKFEICGRF